MAVGIIRARRNLGIETVAIAQMTTSLESFEITGIKTMIPWQPKLSPVKFEAFSIHPRWAVAQHSSA